MIIVVWGKATGRSDFLLFHKVQVNQPGNRVVQNHVHETEGRVVFVMAGAVRKARSSCSSPRYWT